jgi:hypothetical protein
LHAVAAEEGMMKRTVSSVILGLLVVAGGAIQGQTLQSETTWGAAGAEFSGGVAVSPDGSSYLTGTSDSFAVDEFNIPEPRIFLLKFTPDGLLDWQRIWNGRSVHGKTSVATGSDGSVYVTGHSKSNDGDAVLLKFSAAGALIWEREWGGSQQESGSAVASAVDGSVYVAGRTTSFGPSSAGLFVVKFDADGTLLWQKIWDNASGDAVTVAPDGSVYAAATAPRPDTIAEFDVVALKITPGGSLEWARAYQAGVVVDARGGMAAAPDSSSIAIAGAIQAPEGGGVVGIAALLIKIDASGNLVFDREWGGKGGEEASGVSVDQNGQVYMAGTSTSFGGGFQDAFVVSVQANGKAGSAATWGGPGFETGGGVRVTSGGTVVLGATTTVPPPYALLSAPKKVSNPHGSLVAADGALNDATGVVADPAAGATTTNGSTTFSGNFEAALVRFIF